MTWQLVLIAFGTLLSEDLACIAAGVLVAQGKLAFAPAAIAAALGILGGDLALYAAGRLARSVPWIWQTILRFTTEAKIEEGSAWLAKRGWMVVLLSRFTPGLRLPTYLAAGIFRAGFVRFGLYFLLAAVIWTPLLVGVTAKLGEQYLTSFLAQARYVTWLLVAIVAIIAVPHRTRRTWLGFVRRKTQWEFWPVWAAYLPVIPYILYLGLRHRSFMLFTQANPAIPLGGLVGESKSAILDALDPDSVAPYQTVETLDDALAFANEHGFPIVLKPDVGERGDGVKIIRSGEDLAQQLQQSTGRMILQRYVPGVEFGVFYARIPGEANGRILSITEKRFPTLTGDGRRTLEQLVLDDDRAVCLAKVYLERLKKPRNYVPGAGEQVPLAELGSHCKGSIFLDARHRETPALAAAIDRVGRSFQGFHFGRFDIRAASLEAFQIGDFKVIELNGVAGEPAHIYDPAVSLADAYRALFRHWRLAFQIGARNRQLQCSIMQRGDLMATNRRNFLTKTAAAGAVAAAAAAPAAKAQSTATKKVHYRGKKPEKTPLFNGAVSLGNLLFIAGIGAHFQGDIKAHTKHVLDEIQKRLEECGSSMEKVVKCNVYLNDLKDYKEMNEAFLGRFGPEPPVRTTIAAAGGIPGNSLVEIDVIAYI